MDDREIDDKTSFRQYEALHDADIQGLMAVTWKITLTLHLTTVSLAQQ